jgi:Ca-activated chloride channel family protein
MTTATAFTHLSTHAGPAPSNGGRLVTADGRELPLLGVRLTARAGGGVAEVVLEQRFRNPHDAPLAVTYSFPLPADAAVSGYSFTIAGRRVVGEIDRRDNARERFEQALLDGKAAGLVEQERSSLFTQEIGNIPPATEVVATLTIDQRLRWLDEGAWEWRFPTTVAPRFLGAEGRVADAERVSQDVADGPLAARLTLALEVRDALAAGAAPASPSHRLRGSDGGAIAFAADEGDGGGARLDRDVVVRWPVAGSAVGLSVEASRPPAAARNAGSAYGLLTIVPPASAARGDAVARDLIVLLDTSGSMGGAPLDQAQRLVSALIETLGERDQLEMIEFSSAARRWKPGPVAAGATQKREALDWLRRLQASGGTDMRAGILEALRPLRAESQRQIVLVTDGLIGFESEVVAAIARDLPVSSRVHTVGVGSAVNRSLTMAAARAGRGVEVLTGTGEDAERAVRAIVTRTDAPLVVDLVVTGAAVVGHAPRALPDLFAGAPVLIGLALRPEGGAVTVRGRTAAGEWTATAEVPAREPGAGRATPIKLYGRETVEDLEVGAAGAEIDRAIETLGLDFQIATRLTSWIAVSEEPAVDPGAPSKRVRMPHELPHGMSAEGLGLRSAVAAGGVHAFALAAAPASVFDRGAPPRRSRGLAGTMRLKAGAPVPPSPAGPLTRFFGKLLGRPEKKRGGGDQGEAAAAPARALRFSGRITLRKGKTMAVALDVAAELEWDPGAEVQLVWAGGRRARAKVLGGTRRGAVKSGQVIRIIVELDAAEAPPVEMIVAGAGVEITVALAG